MNINIRYEIGEEVRFRQFDVCDCTHKERVGIVSQIYLTDNVDEQHISIDCMDEGHFLRTDCHKSNFITQHDIKYTKDFKWFLKDEVVSMDLLIRGTIRSIILDKGRHDWLYIITDSLNNDYRIYEKDMNTYFEIPRNKSKWNMRYDKR